MTDASRRLIFINSGATESNITRGYLDEIYCINKLDGDTLLQIYRMIDKYQSKDK